MIYNYNGILTSLKKKEILTHATAQMNFEGFMLLNRPVTVSQVPYDPTNLSYLQLSNSYRHKVEWWFPG